MRERRRNVIFRVASTWPPACLNRWGGLAGQARVKVHCPGIQGRMAWLRRHLRRPHRWLGLNRLSPCLARLAPVMLLYQDSSY